MSASERLIAMFVIGCLIGYCLSMIEWKKK
jgi:hypothetical protein